MVYILSWHQCVRDVTSVVVDFDDIAMFSDLLFEINHAKSYADSLNPLSVRAVVSTFKPSPSPS